jgi:lauroyl/myristoyl acyltransferase
MTQWLEQTIGKYPDQWNWMNIRAWDNAADESVAPGDPVRRAS